MRVAEHAAAITGANCAFLTRLNARAGETRASAAGDYPAELATQLGSLDSAAFGHVVRTRSPLVRTGVEAAPLGSVMHAPIELGPRLYGVLTVGHDDEERFSDDDLDLLVKLARSSAAAIANAIDFQRERRIARALTLGFVPESLPELAGYETGLLYAPAANEATGGDVYGAWPVGDGSSVAVLVGDVAGKGVETAALSSMVRFFIEARSWDSPSPAEVLEQANAMLMGRLPRDTFVTAFLGVLSRDSLRYCERRPPAAAPRARRRGEAAARATACRSASTERPGLPRQRAAARARRPRVRAHGRAGRGAPRPASCTERSG